MGAAKRETANINRQISKSCGGENAAELCGLAFVFNGCGSAKEKTPPGH
jgi:hypothetical protein